MITLPKPRFGLGTIGLRYGQFYADICWKPAFQLFINDGTFRRWYSLPTMRLLKVEVLEPKNACRIARRTMYPWAILTTRNGHKKWQAICYPFVHEGGVMIKVREPEEIGAYEIRDIWVDNLRPWNFARRTGIPACDPLP